MLEYPQVALAFMNHDHAEFIEMREQLLAALAKEGTTAEVDALLDHLLERQQHLYQGASQSEDRIHRRPAPVAGERLPVRRSDPPGQYQVRGGRYRGGRRGRAI